MIKTRAELTEQLKDITTNVVDFLVLSVQIKH